jgi:ElaB/YqjD/DUF883 family membrane-anchored ribosome-binding protein
MKSNSEIAPILEKIQKLIRRSSKTAKDLAESQNHLAQFQKIVDGSEEIDYRNDAAVALLGASRIKFELCESAIARGQEALDEIVQEGGDLLTQGGYLAQKVLNPLLERRLKTLTATMRTVCDSNEMAQKLAIQSDSYVTAYGAISGFSGRASQARSQGPEAIFAGLVQVEAVLQEAARGDGADMMSFLSGPPAAPTAAPEAEAPAVCVGDQEVRQ